MVLIVTDDQRFDSISVMRWTMRLLASHRVTFTHAFASNPSCCPARDSLLLGGYSHTTDVYANGGRHGGWRRFHQSGGEDGTIVVDLDGAGYRTGLFGKYLNHYPGGAVARGWDDWAAFAPRGPAGRYYNYDVYVRDAHGERTESYGSDEVDCSTTVIGRAAARFVRTGTPSDTPLFLVVAPFAVHDPITPAPRDVGSFATYP